MGNYPDATAVFDVDAIGLVNIVHNLNRGLDIGGNPIGAATGFVIGVGANPGLPNLDEEIRRFEYKVEAGAEYAVTQPVFDLALLENFLRRIEHCRIPVIAGIWPLVSVRNAEFMKNELRVSVPDAIVERMAAAATPEAARAEGVAIAREMLIAVRELVQGAQISAPNGKYACGGGCAGGAGGGNAADGLVVGRRPNTGGATASSPVQLYPRSDLRLCSCSGASSESNLKSEILRTVARSPSLRGRGRPPPKAGSPTTDDRRLPYHTLHGFALTIGWPALHENACSNSGMFTITPLMRSLDGECGFVIAHWRNCSGRSLEQSHCAKPMKKR